MDINDGAQAVQALVQNAQQGAQGAGQAAAATGVPNEGPPRGSVEQWNQVIQDRIKAAYIYGMGPEVTSIGAPTEANVGMSNTMQNIQAMGMDAGEGIGMVSDQQQVVDRSLMEYGDDPLLNLAMYMSSFGYNGDLNLEY